MTATKQNELLIDRKLLERLQERLDPHLDARDWGMVCDAFRAQSAPEPVHSTQDNYEHFLTYSGLADAPMLRYAYFHGADEGIDKPEPVQGEAVEAIKLPDPSDCYGFGYVDGTCIQSLRGARYHLEEILDGLPREPLMTVAQHNRIMAAASAGKGEPAFMWHKGATEDESEVVDVDCACPCCVPLYTAAAKPDWRAHSVNYAKGEKCPETIETLQAAWDRDQELINDMRHEIARHKTRINRLEQRRTAKPYAELVALLRDAKSALDPFDDKVLEARIDAKLATLIP